MHPTGCCDSLTHPLLLEASLFWELTTTTITTNRNSSRSKEENQTTKKKKEKWRRRRRRRSRSGKNKERKRNKQESTKENQRTKQTELQLPRAPPRGHLASLLSNPFQKTIRIIENHKVFTHHITNWLEKKTMLYNFLCLDSDSMTSWTSQCSNETRTSALFSSGSQRKRKSSSEPPFERWSKEPRKHVDEHRGMCLAKSQVV